MPAVSQQQQKLFGLALAVKRGEVSPSEVSDEVNAIVDRMSEKDIKDFAGTEHSGLPKKVEQQIREMVKQIMRERVLSEMDNLTEDGKMQSGEDDPCWNGYEMVGTKTKDGKEVPNCVPKNESVNEEKYPIAVEKFNKELIKHPMVKKAAQHYKTTPTNIVKALQQRLYSKGDKTGNTKEVWIDFKDTTSGITIKHKMKFNESVNEASIDVDVYRKKQAFVIGPKFAEVASDKDVELMARLKRANSEHAWQLKQNISSMDHLYKKYKIQSSKGIEK